MLLKLKNLLTTSDKSLAWEHILISLVFTLSTAPIVYSATSKVPQSYTQPIVGSLSWTATSKFPDYTLLVSIVVCFCIAYLTIFVLSQLISRNNGKNVEKAFRAVLALSTLPVLLWIGGLFLNQNLSLSLLLVSFVVIVFVIIFSVISAIKQLKFSDEQEFIDCISTSVLSIFGSGLASIAIMLAIGRIHLDWQLKNATVTEVAALATSLLTFLLMLFIWLYRSNTGTAILKRIRTTLLLIQIFLPLSFLLLIPTPWETPQGKLYGYPIRFTLYVLIGILIGLSYLDLARRFKSHSNSNALSIKSALSPLCLTALLFLIKQPSLEVASISADDYHVGEFLLPLWLWRDFGYIPFQDYTPARGLVNYLPALFADIFFDGTASSQIASNGVCALLFLLIGFTVVSRSIGIMPAFMAFLLMPLANGVQEIDILVTVVLCLFCESFLKHKSALWLVIWFALGVVLFLFAPGQGGLLLISTVPLVLAALWKAISQEKRQLLFYFISGLVVSVLLSILTPIAQMIFGAWRYLREQSTINSIAHGIAWSSSVGQIGKESSINYWLWEAIRSSWIIVAIIAIVLIWWAIIQPNWLERRRLLVFAIPIFLLVVLFIPRAAGRIDPGALSRLGIASTWSLTLLLPLLFLPTFNYFQKPLILLLTAFASGLVTSISSVGGLFIPVSGMVQATVEKPSAVSQLRSQIVNGAEINLPQLGKAMVEPAQLKRLQSIQDVLSKVLAPGETYLDLTNRNANYFYLGYPPPIEVGAPYNLVENNQQLRALHQLQKVSPPIVLISADNILHDGGTVAVRSYLIYRYVVENYLPVKIGDFIYMIRPDRVKSLTSIADNDLQSVNIKTFIQDRETQLSLLDIAFRMDNLNALPISWGRSFKTLQSQLNFVSLVGSETIPSLFSLEKINTNTYRTTGKNPSIAFNIESLKLNGRKAGLLGFEFSCSNSNNWHTLEISWNSISSPSTKATVVSFRAANGKLLVPMDIAPRWLLAEDIQSIEFRLIDSPQCGTLSLSDITFFQRTTVSKSVGLTSTRLDYNRN